MSVIHMKGRDFYKLMNLWGWSYKGNKRSEKISYIFRKKFNIKR